MNRASDKFDNGLAGIQSVSLSKSEKGAIFSKLERYVEAHPAVTQEHHMAALQRVMKGVFSIISWK